MTGPGVFGTEMHATTFILCGLEIAVLFYQLPNYLVRTHDKSRRRYLLLIFLFIYYNLVSGLLPDHQIPIPQLVQLTLAYSGGILLAIYYFYYLTAEMGIRFSPYFKFKFLITTVGSAFAIGFVGIWLFTENLDLSRFGFMWYPVLLAMLLLSKLVLSVNRLAKERHIMNPVQVRGLYLNYSGSFFMAMLPCIAFFGEFQTIEVLVTNASFVVTSIAYIDKWAYQAKLESNWLAKAGFQNGEIGGFALLQELKATLSSRELEITNYLLKDNLDYNGISEQLFISPKTVSKHASNVFKKVGVNNRASFIEKYGTIQHTDNQQQNQNTYEIRT